MNTAASLTPWIGLPVVAGLAMLFLSSCACACKRTCSGGAPPESQFEKRMLPGAGMSYPVDVTPGRGRPVLLLHELNGQSPGSLSLAQELAGLGCKVYVPRFFGCYGDNRGVAHAIGMLFSARWQPFNASDLGPIRADVRALARAVMDPGINPGARDHTSAALTVIGNCMTGSLPLELLSEEGVATAVVCQPAMPFAAWTAARKRALGVPDNAVSAALNAMVADPRKRLISFNYAADKVGRIERTEALAARTTLSGVADQHLLFIGAGPGGLAAAGTKKPVLPAGTHYLSTATDGGHSTVTGAKCEDLHQFRTQLFQALGLPPAHAHP